MAKYGQRMDEEMPNQDWERDYTKGQIRITVKNTLPQTVTYATPSWQFPNLTLPLKSGVLNPC